MFELVEQVKRESRPLPEDFMCQLNKKAAH